MSSLLPPNATEIERRLAVAGAAIAEIPNPIRDIGQAATCPANVLPFLAWERSVDRWEPEWSEATKRAVIDASFLVHQRKGTVGAIRRAIEPLGFEVRVVPWYEMQPEGRRGTFRLDVHVLSTGVREELHAALERVINDAKPLSRHMVGMSLTLATKARHAVSAVAQLGDEVTVYPFVPPAMSVPAQQAAMGAVHVIDTLTISE